MATNPAWDGQTTGTEIAEQLAEHIKGRVVLITGVSPESLGGVTAVTIARHSPSRLILASRTLSKLQSVATQITENACGIEPDLIELDLGSLTAVRAAAEKVLNLVSHIDVVIHSAAAVSSERRETVDGFESQLGINHMGPFLLTSLVMPLLKSAAANSGKTGVTRIVNTSSLGYRLSPFRFHDYNFEGKAVPVEEQPPAAVPHYMKPVPEQGRNYYVFCAYGQSKTANILHAVSLSQKFGHEGIRGFALHPGCEFEPLVYIPRRAADLRTAIWTELSRSLSPEDYAIVEKSEDTWKNHDQGIATTIVAAFDPHIAEQTKYIYLNNCQLVDVEPYAKDSGIAEKLWQLSEKLVGLESKL